MANDNQATFMTILQYAPTLMAIINAVEAGFGPGNGAGKKDAAVKAFDLAIGIVAPIIEKHTPTYAALVGRMTDDLVAWANEYAALSDAYDAAHPPVIVVPPPAVPVVIPPVITPTAPPVIAPAAGNASYNEPHVGPLPGDDALKALGYKTADRKFEAIDGGRYLVMDLVGAPGTGGLSNPSWPGYAPAGAIA